MFKSLTESLVCSCFANTESQLVSTVLFVLTVSESLLGSVLGPFRGSLLRSLVCELLLENFPFLGSLLEVLLGYLECLLFLGMELQQLLLQTDLSGIEGSSFTFQWVVSGLLDLNFPRPIGLWSLYQCSKARFS